MIICLNTCQQKYIEKGKDTTADGMPSVHFEGSVFVDFCFHSIFHNSFGQCDPTELWKH